MKKLMLALAVASLSSAAIAQETYTVTDVPVKEKSVGTNSFWSNWFISAGVNYNAFYSSQEEGISKNPFNDRGKFGFNVAVGKWFTPGLGIRAKFDGVKGVQVNGGVWSPDNIDFDYWNLHSDVLFNLSNMIFGYNENRVWNFIPYLGAGVIRNCSQNNYMMGANVGILNTFRLNKRLSVNFELSALAAPKSFDGIGYKASGNKIWRGADKVFTASVGLTVNLGKTTGFRKAVDVDALMALNASQLDALNSALAAQQNENARLKEELAKKPKEVIKTDYRKEYVGAPRSIFFNIGSSQIASRKEIVNLQVLADAVKADSNIKLKVTGYADSATGSAAFNQKLSEKRANRVADELVKLGVSRDNLVVEGLGGVATLKPNSYNRRVIVDVVK